MRETALEFGPGRRLVGVLSRPDSQNAPAPVCVVLTNSGIIHRAGANRLHVRLARTLAAGGYPVLRYDLPGIGDSETSGEVQDLAREQLEGTYAALDMLQKLQVAEHFVMLGLCSGAGHSLFAAVADPRIRGAILIDPPVAVATRRHRLNQLIDAARRGLRPRVWWRLVRGHYQLRQMLQERSIEPARPGMPVSLPNSPLHELRRQTADALRVLSDRQVRVLLFITGHNRDVYSYPRQLFDAFPEIAGLESLVQVLLRPTAGHTFGKEVERQFLVRALLAWLERGGFAPLSPAARAEGVPARSPAALPQ